MVGIPGVYIGTLVGYPVIHPKEAPWWVILRFIPERGTLVVIPSWFIPERGTLVGYSLSTMPPWYPGRDVPSYMPPFPPLVGRP